MAGPLNNLHSSTVNSTQTAASHDHTDFSSSPGGDQPGWFLPGFDRNRGVITATPSDEMRAMSPEQRADRVLSHIMDL